MSKFVVVGGPFMRLGTGLLARLLELSFCLGSFEAFLLRQRPGRLSEEPSDKLMVSKDLSLLEEDVEEGSDCKDPSKESEESEGSDIVIRLRAPF